MQVTATTQNIKVSVEPIYQPTYSKPLMHEYVHAYRITIENVGDESVQLLRRHWYIWDSNGMLREVEGEGVVGKQPLLHPSDRHTYVSGCPLRTDIGKMYGTYLMERKSDGRQFNIEIPVFDLIPPFKYN